MNEDLRNIKSADIQQMTPSLARNTGKRKENRHLARDDGTDGTKLTFQ